MNFQNHKRDEILIKTKLYHGFYLLRYIINSSSFRIVFTKNEAKKLHIKENIKYKIFINGNLKEVLKPQITHNGMYYSFKLNLFVITTNEEEIKEVFFEEV